MAQTVKLKRTLNAPPAEVYRAFTNATALREWCCDVAHVIKLKGGPLYLWWNSGYYASGEFTSLVPGKKVAFTWQGRGEPGVTRVQVTLTAKDDGTVVTLTHGGFGSGTKWAQVRRESEHGWQAGLENLQAMLETGQDLRYVRRPMLGVNVGEFNAEVAAKLGVPVTEGIRLEDTAETMGARAAGLQKDDVIVSVGGKKVTGWPTMVTALQPHRASDQVAIVFYRGSEKKTARLELSPRPLPEVPPTAQALAEAMRKIQARLDADLAGCFRGVSEEEASHKPATTEWSAKETVAHFIVTERETHAWIADMINSDERWSQENPTNVSARIGAAVAVFGTVAALLEELKHNEAETVAMLAALPPEFVAHKGSYWRLGHYLLQIDEHTQEHLKQIRAAIEAARKR